MVKVDEAEALAGSVGTKAAEAGAMVETDGDTSGTAKTGGEDSNTNGSASGRMTAATPKAAANKIKMVTNDTFGLSAGSSA